MPHLTCFLESFYFSWSFGNPLHLLLLLPQHLEQEQLYLLVWQQEQSIFLLHDQA
jgi:hypothetical protein